jgi:hypothetical protein
MINGSRHVQQTTNPIAMHGLSSKTLQNSLMAAHRFAAFSVAA